MKSTLIRGSLVASLAACNLVACGNGDPQDVGEATTATDDFYAEVPVTSAALPGATLWQFTMEADGGRAVAVDADGNALIELSLRHADGTTTIEDLATGERFVVDGDGAIVENTITEASPLPTVARGLNADVEAFIADHPERPQGCGWDFFMTWVWCTGAVATCVHPVGQVTGTCVGFVVSCGGSAGSFYFNCMSS
jgi:hypothetical protein